MVCAAFLYRLPAHSLSSSARTMGTGNWNSSLPTLIRSVVNTERRKAASRNTYMKFSQPHQGLPQIPPLAL